MYFRTIHETPEIMKVLNNLFFTLMLLALHQTSVAQIPDWADAKIRKMRYSESDYIVGFASEPNSQGGNSADLLYRLEAYAKGQLVEYIQVTVRSETEMRVSETNSKYQQSYMSMNSSSSNLSLTGLKVETAYDQKGKTGYALAYAKRSELLSYYKETAKSNLHNAEVKIKSAQQAMKSSNGEQALKLTLEAISLINPVEQAQSVIFALRRGDTTDEETQMARLSKAKTDIEEIMRQVQRSSGNTIDDISYFLARGLMLQTGKLSTPISLSNFTYQDTKIGSELSNRLNQSLTSKLVDNGFQVTTSGVKTEGLILTGTYWKEPTDLKLIATFKKTDGNIVATSEAFLPLSWIEGSNIKYLPENFEDAFSRMRVFNRDEVVKGDLNVEVWTNKGDDGLVFTEGERLKFFIRANKECYLRFIYHLADNQSVLLMDSYYVAAHMANKVIELPDEFECAEPFGVETLQVNAQTEPFAPLRTRSMYGYQFIEDSFSDILLGTRGIKKIEEKPVDRAEKRIVFTTMKR
jgi:predicted DNA-binding transcriptional regulator